jgi:hypothetical protein
MHTSHSRIHWLWAAYAFAVILKLILFHTILTSFTNNTGAILSDMLFQFAFLGAMFTLLIKLRKRGFFLVFYFLEALYVVVNLAYFLYFRNYLFFQQISANSSSALTLVRNHAIPMRWEYLIGILDLPFAVGIASLWNQFRDDHQNGGIVVKYGVLIASCAAFIIGILITPSPVHLRHEKFQARESVISHYGLLTLTTLDLFSRDQSEKGFIARLKLSDRTLEGSAKPDKKNVVIIQIESMGANVVNAVYKNKPVMPYLSSLSKHSVYYPFAMSYHKGGYTSDCEFSVINSTEPLADYMAINLSSYNYPNAMAARFLSNGYATRAFHGNNGSFYNRITAFSRMGYQNFYDKSDINVFGYKGVWGIPDNEVFQFALKKMREEKGPFYYHIISMTSHEPFDLADPFYRNPLYDRSTNAYLMKYFNSFSYVDQCISNFLENMPDKTNTVVVIYGDHTPALNNRYFPEAAFTCSNVYMVFVPLLILTPDRQVYRESNLAASFLDISPTMMKLAGIRFRLRTDGEDLMNFGGLTNAVPLSQLWFNRKFMFSNVTEAVRDKSES